MPGALVCGACIDLRGKSVYVGSSDGKLSLADKPLGDLDCRKVCADATRVVAVGLVLGHQYGVTTSCPAFQVPA